MLVIIQCLLMENHAGTIVFGYPMLSGENLVSLLPLERLFSPKGDISVDMGDGDILP